MTKIKCQCGSSVGYYYLSKHLRTNLHHKKLNHLNQPSIQDFLDTHVEYTNNKKQFIMIRDLCDMYNKKYGYPNVNKLVRLNNFIDELAKWCDLEKFYKKRFRRIIYLCNGTKDIIDRKHALCFHKLKV